MNSLIAALAFSSTPMSRKFPSQMPKPGSAYSFYQNASRSSRGTSIVLRRLAWWMNHIGVEAQWA